jgi:hypothetical protein
MVCLDKDERPLVAMCEVALCHRQRTRNDAGMVNAGPPDAAVWLLDKAWVGRPFWYISELRRNELEVYFLGGRSDSPLNIKGRYRNGTYDNIHTGHCVVDGCRWRALTGAVSDAGDERYSLGDGQLRKNLFRRHVPSCVAGQRRQRPFKFLAQIVT